MFLVYDWPGSGIGFQAEKNLEKTELIVNQVPETSTTP